MALPLVFAAATFALQAGSTIAAHNAARANAKAQNRYNEEMTRIRAQHRDEVMRWQNEVWEQDLDHARETLRWAEDEFDRQVEWATQAKKAVTRNRDAEAFTLMLRGIEENIGFSLGVDQDAKTGRAIRAAMRVQERGVEGTSVDLALGEVERKEGEARTVAELNRSATMRQLYRESQALDAAADQQLAHIASGIRTFSPHAPIRPPTPVNPIQPAAPTPAPSPMSLVAGLGNAVSGAFNTYNTLSGQEAKQTFNQLSGWVSRQFSFGR